LICDEIDGLSAGDRGGSTAMIEVIKNTKIPIICICNERMSNKVKSLANHCYDLRFSRPNKTQIAKRIMEIAKEEGLNCE